MFVQAALGLGEPMLEVGAGGRLRSERGLLRLNSRSAAATASPRMSQFCFDIIELLAERHTVCRPRRLLPLCALLAFDKLSVQLAN